jgi:glycine cleavage system aminomethyltransferase T
MAHYENGFPQAFLDFPYAPYGGDFLDYLDHSGPMGVQFRKLYVDVLLSGSMGDDIKLRYRTPVELGWGGMVKFDHDFIGRAALEKEVAHPRRKMVTLDWNIDDVFDVHRSQFEPGEPYQNMDEPEDWTRLLFSTHRAEYLADQVLVEDKKVVGISTGRMVSACYRKMISLCSIDVEHSDLGSEVKVIWGNPNTRQKEIRAIVSRYPFMDKPRNENIDVSTIPHLKS